MNPEIRKDSENIEAFDSFVRDAVCGKDSFENFCSELGYDTDSRSAERIHKACIVSLHKLERIYGGDVYDLANELSEKVN